MGNKTSVSLLSSDLLSVTAIGGCRNLWTQAEEVSLLRAEQGGEGSGMDLGICISMVAYPCFAHLPPHRVPSDHYRHVDLVQMSLGSSLGTRTWHHMLLMWT